MTDAQWHYNLHIDPEGAPLVYSDRSMLRFTQLLTSGGARVFNGRSGDHLFRFEEKGDLVREMHALSSNLLALLDVRHFVETDLQGSFAPLPPVDLTPQGMRTLHEMAQAARDELEGEKQTIIFGVRLTVEIAGLLDSGRKMQIREVKHLALQGATPLQLVKESWHPRLLPSIRAGGFREAGSMR